MLKRNGVLCDEPVKVKFLPAFAAFCDFSIPSGERSDCVYVSSYFKIRFLRFPANATTMGI